MLSFIYLLLLLLQMQTIVWVNVCVPLTAQAGIHPLTPLNLNYTDRNICFMPLLISRTRIEDDFKEIWCPLFCNSFLLVHIFNNDLLPSWICVYVCFYVSILRLHSWCQYFNQHVSVVFVFSLLSVQFGVTSCGDCFSFLGFSLYVI